LFKTLLLLKSVLIWSTNYKLLYILANAGNKKSKHMINRIWYSFFIPHPVSALDQYQPSWLWDLSVRRNRNKKYCFYCSTNDTYLEERKPNN